MFGDLWQSALRAAAAHDLAMPEAIQRVAQEAGRLALGCIAAATSADEAALRQRSASLLTALTLLWAATEIEPDEIWMELHKRERLGSLLHEMARRQGKPKRSQARPWRVDSTKLP